MTHDKNAPWAAYLQGGITGAALVVALLLLTGSGPTYVTGDLEQRGTLLNQHADSGVNAPVSIVLAGVAGTQNHIYGVLGGCDTGTADLDIQEQATLIFQTASNSINTVSQWYTFTVPLTANLGNSMTVTLGACGVGNIGHLAVQADRH